MSPMGPSRRSGPLLQQRMSVASRKRQLATKVRRVVKGQYLPCAPLAKPSDLTYSRLPRSRNLAEWVASSSADRSRGGRSLFEPLHPFFWASR
jgi:hypothetical protein